MLDSLSSNLDQYMTLLSVRQKLVASNIANADTPDYKTKDIDFESEFRHSMASTSAATPSITDVAGLRVKADGNNVDLDREARLLSENAIRFSVASQLLRGQIKNIRMAIGGGGSNS